MKRQQYILTILLSRKNASSSEISEILEEQGNGSSLITIKRELSLMIKSGLINRVGSGRSVKYEISERGRLIADVDAKTYVTIDPDNRYGLRAYNFKLFESISGEMFSEKELNILNEKTSRYLTLSKDVSPVIREKELERFVIELSWKSSKIEGNTYTLLDTEKLIKQGIEAVGHDKDESRMILNHKDAFKFVLENVDSFKNLTLPSLEELHKIITKDMGVSKGLRSKPVGVVGSIYRPLDNVYQIKEEVNNLCSVVSKIESPYLKAMIALLGISYLQPFEDGNKRTSRLVANAILLAFGCAPLSYRSVDENSYREATLVFYELNSFQPFKKIFFEQYIFAVENYLVGGEALI